MALLLEGKTALVTGGTAGIGKAIALLFAQNGADVIIFGTNAGRATTAVAEIESAKASSSPKSPLFPCECFQIKRSR